MGKIDSIVAIVAKKSKLLAIIFMFAATAFSLIVYAAGIGGAFMPVVGGLLLFLFQIALVGVIPVLLVLKKDELIKYALVPIFSYWLISSIYSFLGNSDLIAKGYAGVTIAMALFQFFIALAQLAVIAFMIVYLFKKEKKWAQIAFCILVGSLVFYLVEWALSLGMYAKYDAAWTNYFYAFYAYIFLPAGMVFVLLSQANVQPKAAETALVEDAAPVEEAPAEEAPAEDTPAEEPKADDAE